MPYVTSQPAPLSVLNVQRQTVSSSAVGITSTAPRRCMVEISNLHASDNLIVRFTYNSPKIESVLSRDPSIAEGREEDDTEVTASNGIPVFPGTTRTFHITSEYVVRMIRGGSNDIDTAIIEYGMG